MSDIGVTLRRTQPSSTRLKEESKDVRANEDLDDQRSSNEKGRIRIEGLGQSSEEYVVCREEGAG